MKVILLKDHKTLGYKGDVVDVKEGYAINFLFPQHIAAEASPKALHNLQEQKKAEQRRVSKKEEEARQMAASLDGYELVILTKTNDDMTLYAAVGPKDVAKRLRQEEFGIVGKQVKMKAMKEVGEQDVTIQFEGGNEAKIKVIVEAQTV